MFFNPFAMTPLLAAESFKITASEWWATAWWCVLQTVMHDGLRNFPPIGWFFVEISRRDSLKKIVKISDPAFLSDRKCFGQGLNIVKFYAIFVYDNMQHVVSKVVGRNTKG